MTFSFMTKRFQKKPGMDVHWILGVALVATIRAWQPAMADDRSAFATSATTHSSSCRPSSCCSLDLLCVGLRDCFRLFKDDVISCLAELLQDAQGRNTRARSTTKGRQARAKRSEGPLKPTAHLVNRRHRVSDNRLNKHQTQLELTKMHLRSIAVAYLCNVMVDWRQPGQDKISWQHGQTPQVDHSKVHCSGHAFRTSSVRHNALRLY